MRFRNVPPPAGQSAGNGRANLLGRQVRSRVFVPLDAGPLFQMPDLPDARPTLVLDEKETRQLERLEEMQEGLAAVSVGPVEWDSNPPVPVPPMTDTLPPRREPQDARVGGVDHVAGAATPPTRTFDVNGSTTSHDLNVSSPTVANCAQVLSALLTDLQTQELVRRV